MTSMNIHRIESVAARVDRSSDPTHVCEWLKIEFRDEDGSRFDLAAHSSNATALLAQLSGDFAKGIEAAAALLDKKADDYDAEHGNTDPDTGTREYPGRGAGEDYYNSLRELADDIRALASLPT
jgi:hypothetical protein